MKKKAIIMILCSCFVLILLYLFYQPHVSRNPVVIQDQLWLPSNYRQNQTTVQMWTDHSQLYFCTCDYPTVFNQTKYFRWFSVFEGGGVERMKKMAKNFRIVGVANGFMYYWKRGENVQDIDVLYAYELSTGKETSLYSGTEGTGSYLDKDGTIYISLNLLEKEKHEYLPVYKNEPGEVQPFYIEYQLGDYLYSIEENGVQSEEILRVDQNGTVEQVQLPYADKRTLIPCENGLLIHNEGRGELLYWVDEEGEVTSLFSVPCILSDSSVTVYGTSAYLSFIRYEKHGEIGQVRYKNDTLEGTYKIDLRTFSAEKISDKVYCGLYNFDDTCIYACDEDCHIYKLDSEANIIDALIS